MGSMRCLEWHWTSSGWSWIGLNDSFRFPNCQHLRQFHSSDVEPWAGAHRSGIQAGGEDCAIQALQGVGWESGLPVSWHFVGCCVFFLKGVWIHIYLRWWFQSHSYLDWGCDVLKIPINWSLDLMVGMIHRWIFHDFAGRPEDQNDANLMIKGNNSSTWQIFWTFLGVLVSWGPTQKFLCHLFKTKNMVSHPFFASFFVQVQQETRRSGRRISLGGRELLRWRHGILDWIGRCSASHF